MLTQAKVIKTLLIPCKKVGVIWIKKTTNGWADGILEILKITLDLEGKVTGAKWLTIGLTFWCCAARLQFLVAFRCRFFILHLGGNFHDGPLQGVRAALEVSLCMGPSVCGCSERPTVPVGWGFIVAALS